MLPLQDEVLDVLLSALSKYDNFIPKETFVEYLKTPPRFTTVRVNPLAGAKEDLKADIVGALEMQYVAKGIPCPSVDFHPLAQDVLVVKSNCTPVNIVAKYAVVVVGLQCGIAVLRGSQVYAPGVTAIPTRVTVGDTVSVFADLTGQCKKGWMTNYDGPLVFVGNGILLQSRKDLFAYDKNMLPRGIAINMVEPIFDCPSIGDILLSDAGLQKGFLQNLPSIICGHALQPLAANNILDMCAAPGGKTTHIANLIGGKGEVIALDKSIPKIQQIRDNAAKLGLDNIRAFVFDSTNACVDTAAENQKLSSGSLVGPPFSPEFFDRILLDAPCSSLGQRPQLYNPIRLKEVQSFARLQRKLFITAVKLLKPGGRMVYSTCTYNVEENEEIISWALRTFPFLQIVAADIQIGEPGYRVDSLTEVQCCAMQRFGSSFLKDSDVNTDTIGFFMCCLEKKKMP